MHSPRHHSCNGGPTSKGKEGRGLLIRGGGAEWRGPTSEGAEERRAGKESEGRESPEVKVSRINTGQQSW